MEFGRRRGEKHFKQKESKHIGQVGDTRECVPTNSHSSSQFLCKPFNPLNEFSLL